MTCPVCPYYAAAEQFPGADPNGRCDGGCSGMDGPACFDFAEPESLHRARMLRIWNARRGMRTWASIHGQAACSGHGMSATDGYASADPSAFRRFVGLGGGELHIVDDCDERVRREARARNLDIIHHISRPDGTCTGCPRTTTSPPTK